VSFVLQVRSNAAQLAFACFPLQDPAEGAPAVDAALARQFKVSFPLG
jgi:hypothetical protein